jgi:hypothetical protein
MQIVNVCWQKHAREIQSALSTLLSARSRDQLMAKSSIVMTVAAQFNDVISTRHSKHNRLNSTTKRDDFYCCGPSQPCSVYVLQ